MIALILSVASFEFMKAFVIFSVFLFCEFWIMGRCLMYMYSYFRDRKYSEQLQLEFESLINHAKQ